MSTRTWKTSWGFAVLVACILGVALPAQAVSYYWDIDGATAGAGGATPSGTWSNGGTYWSTDSTGSTATSPVTIAIGDNVYFSAGTDATGAYTVTIGPDDTHVWPTNITFEEGSVTLASLNNYNTWLRVDQTGGITANVAAAATPTITAAIYGNSWGTLTKTGPGTLILASVKPSYNTTIVNGGTLRLGRNGVDDNNTGVPLSMTVNSGGTFDLGGYNQTINWLTLAGGSINLGGGTLTSDWSQTVTGTGNLVYGNGKWVITGRNNGQVNLASGAELTITSVLDMSSGGDHGILGPTTGTGTVILANPTPNANLFNNFRLDRNATLKLGANEQFPDTFTWYVMSYSDPSNPSTFDLNGFNETFQAFGGYCQYGTVKVNGGTLTLTNGAPWGQNGLKMAFGNNGTLKYNNSGNWTMSMPIDVGAGGGKIDTSTGNGYTEINGTVTGSGTLTVKTGTQKMYFNPATYSGFNGTVIADAGAGGVEVASKTYNATTTFGAINGGTMKLDGNGSSGYITAAGATVDRPGGTWTLTGSGTVITASGTNTFSGGNTVAWTGDKTINVTSGTTTSAWYLNGGSTMHVTFTGAGTFINTNAWNLGNMTVDGGNYNYQGTSTNGQNITTLTVKNGGTWTTSGGTTNGDVNLTNAPILNGGTISGQRKLSIQGGANSDMVVSDGTSAISAGMWLQNQPRNIVVNSGTLTISSTHIENNQSITKKGVGTLVLSGILDGSWNGGSLLAAEGTTLVNGTLNRPVTVSSGATLGGSGTVNNTVTFAGTVAPGSSPGTLTVANATSAPGGTLAIEVQGMSAGAFDVLKVTSALDLTAPGDILDVYLNGPYYSQIGDTIPFLTFGSRTGTGTFDILRFGGATRSDVFHVNWKANAADIVFDIAIPEPATMALLGLGAVGMLIRRRNRKS